MRPGLLALMAGMGFVGGARIAGGPIFYALADGGEPGLWAMVGGLIGMTVLGAGLLISKRRDGT